MEKNADKKKVDEIFKFIKIISQNMLLVVIFNSTISS